MRKPRPAANHSLEPTSPTHEPSNGKLAESTIERMALRLDDLTKVLGLSRRAIERLRSAGKFPKPDRVVGRVPLWSPETIRRWVEGGDGS